MNKSIQATKCTYRWQTLACALFYKKGAWNAKSEILIVNKLLPFGENKVQGVVLIPESININLAQMGASLT